MAAVVEEIKDLDPTRNDDAFRRMLNESQDNVEDFLKSVFSFLKRNTSYMGREGSEKVIIKVAREFQPFSKGVKSGFFGGKPSKGAPESKPTPLGNIPAAKAAPEPAAGTPAAPPAPAPDADDAPSTLGHGAAVSGSAASASAAKVETLPEEPQEAEGSGLPPNAGNGLDLETYSWTQTLADLVLSVPVPSGTRGRDCDVAIGGKSLRVGLKGAAAVLDGALCKPVQEDECFWNCDGKTIEVTLQKKDTMNWWSRVVEGEPEVNTQKVQPENSRLSDLDGETRKTVEKMMFDQRQKAAGKPTSDEAQRQEMLQKFMTAHPEMDFSNAKLM